MSWMPSADPILGDKRSCDALELVVIPRMRDLGGGFAVRRAMPNEKRQMVGPTEMVLSVDFGRRPAFTRHGDPASCVGTKESKR